MLTAGLAFTMIKLCAVFRRHRPRGKGRDSLFKYCPFCGQKLVPTGSMFFKYCPECGGKLEHINSIKPIELPLAEIKCVEEQKPMQTIVGEEQGIRMEAEQFFAKLKGKVLAVNMCQTTKPSEETGSDAYYSIILKSCENKEHLARALKQVFTRSFLATRMAIDNMPGILVYKGKVEGMAPIIRVLQSQNSSFSIVPGNFNFKTQLPAIFPNFNSLFPEVQNLIKGTPLNLWLGENILGVFPDVYQESLGEENKGSLVISDQAIYFVYKEFTTADYLSVVIPYRGIEQLFLEEGREYDGLVINYKDGRDEDMLVIADELILSEAYEVSRKAMKDQQNCIMVKRSCPQCGHEEFHAAADDTVDEKCVYCGKKLYITLAQNQLM